MREMNHSFHTTRKLALSIAGIPISLSCPPGVGIRFSPSQSIQAFVRPPVSDCDEGETGPDPVPAIIVDVVVGSLPPMDRLVPFFIGGPAWTLFRDGEEYWMVNKPPGWPKPVWAARISAGREQVTLHCGERMVAREGSGHWVADPFCYPLDQFVCMLHLATRGGVIVHAAGMETARGGFVFAGRSGAGKSTLSRQLAGREGVRAFSDDRIVLRKIGGGFRMYGTPWPGEAEIAVNGWAPLERVLFLCKSPEDRLVPLTPGEAMERLMPVVSAPWFSRELIVPQLAFLDELLAAVPAFDLHFRPTPAVAELLLGLG